MGCDQTIGENQVRLYVRDTGTGMDPKLLSQIFVPFFTTKKSGHGTGLGLSVVSGIIHDLQGHILVESSPGKGTITSVFLPESKSSHSVNEVRTEFSEEEYFGDTPKVLLIDDDAMLLKVMGNLFMAGGYEVEVFLSCDEGWRRFQENPNGFDLVFTDFEMEGMRGVELCQKIRGLGSRVPCIIYSGCLDAMAVEKINELEGVITLNKPTKVGDILTLCRRVLLESQTRSELVEPGALH